MKLTEEDCITEAKKYSRKIDFRRSSPEHYRAARNLKCLDKCHEHMEPVYKSYTEEDIIEKAKMCSTRIEFRTKYNGLYQAARKRGLEQLCYSHMDELKHSWTTEDIKQEALKYKKRSDFMRNSGSAYAAAIRKGLLDEVCQHMEVLVEWWDKDEVSEIAKSCSSVKEFKHKNKQAYAACLRRGWYDLLSHLTRDNLWSDDELLELSKSFTYTWEFAEKMPWAYKLAKERGLLGDLIVCQKPRVYVSGVVKEPEVWDIKKLEEAAKSCKTIGEFIKKFGGARKFAEENGLLWSKQFFSHFVRKDGSSIHEEYRTKDECHAEALKYHSRRSFYLGSSKYYSYAKYHGWLDEICDHMELMVKQRTFDECSVVAKRYKSRRKFYLGDTKIYSYALQHGWLEQICSHMVRGKTGFNPELKGYLYVVSTDKFLGFGITNDIDDRMKKHNKSFMGSCVKIEDSYVLEFELGQIALDLERHLKKQFKGRILDTGIDGFKREAVSLELSAELDGEVKKFLTDLNEPYKILT